MDNIHIVPDLYSEKDRINKVSSYVCFFRIKKYVIINQNSYPNLPGWLFLYNKEKKIQKKCNIYGKNTFLYIKGFPARKQETNTDHSIKFAK